MLDRDPEGDQLRGGSHRGPGASQHPASAEAVTGPGSGSKHRSGAETTVAWKCHTSCLQQGETDARSG